MAIDLTWKFADGIHTLHRGGLKTPVISVVPDKIYPTMWRIRTRDGLSDMVNLSRARDAAVALAMDDYRRETKGVRAVEAGRDSLKESGATRAAVTSANRLPGLTAGSSLAA